MAEETTICIAKRSFAEFVPGHGIVAGDPDAKDGKKVPVPNSTIERFVELEMIEKPKGFAPQKEREQEAADVAAAEEAARAAAEAEASVIGEEAVAAAADTEAPPA